MKKLLLILMLLMPFWSLSQTHTLTDKEMIEIDSLFQVYEQKDSLQKLEINLLNTQLLNYQRLHTQDSLELNFMRVKTDLLNERIDLYIDLTKELKPKWYNKPIVHFFLGAATITTAAVVLDKIQ
jgi:hypothetical protein|tara:strand:+ start:31386 stop:31760 length:375 start_codon:yes stop_codon:yes gene_type:complete